MKSDWCEPYKYWDPFIEWKAQKENEIKESTKEN